MALGAVALPSASSSSACDLYASPTGSNANSGSFNAPFQTVPYLISKLSAAQPTGCLKGYPDGGPPAKSGLHELTAALNITKPGISLRSADGHVAQLKGPITITGDDVTLSGLVLDSRINAARLASPVVDGDRVKLIDNDITSRGGSNCVTVRVDASDVEIQHNRIHNCGTAIRLDKSESTIIESNLIYRNSKDGVRMYPDADNTYVHRNIIDSNADNVVIGGDPASASLRSDDTNVSRNVISNPQGFNLTDGGGTMGDGNLFTSNCVHKSGDAANGIDDVTSSSPVPGRAWASDTTFGDPRYVATRGPNAYRLQPSTPCTEAGFAPVAIDAARPSQAEAVNLRPNIVFIVTDDQRADTMHVSPPVMPNVLKWFRDGDPAAGVVGGTEYVNAFATTPMCCPARASIFSGRYPHNHGVIKNTFGPKLLSTSTVQRYLNDIGYENAIFGKYLNGWTPVPPAGAACNPCNAHEDAPEAGPAPNFDQYSIFEGYKATNLNVSAGVTPPGADEYTTDYVFDRAQEFVQGHEGANDGTPWFLYLAPQAPHESAGNRQKYGPDAWKRMLEDNRLGVNENTPVPAHTQDLEDIDDVLTKPRYVQQWGAPPMFTDYRTVFESPGLPGLQKQQLRSLIPVDDGVNRLFTKLEDTGEADDTLAVFISDNGYQWREHAAEGGDCVDSAGVGRSTPCGPTGKARPYRESVKVPFYVRWPGHPDVGASTTATQMVTNLDPAVTVMDVIDAQPSGAADQPVMDGWSLFSFWRRTYVLTENLAGELDDVPGWRALRTNSALYVRYLDDPFTPAADCGLPGALLTCDRPGRAPEPAGGQRAARPGRALTRRASRPVEHLPRLRRADRLVRRGQGSLPLRHSSVLRR